MGPAIAAFGIFVTPSADMIAASANAAKPVGRPNASAKADAHSSFSDLLAAANPAADSQKSDAPADRVTPDIEDRATQPQDMKAVAKGTTAHKATGKKEDKEDKPEADDAAGDQPEALAAEASATAQMIAQPLPAAPAAPQATRIATADETSPAPNPIKAAGPQSAHAEAVVSAAHQKPAAASPRAAAPTLAIAVPPAADATIAPPAGNPDNAKAPADAPASISAHQAAAAPGLAHRAVPAAPAILHRAEPAAANAAADTPVAQAATEASDSLAMAVKTAAAGAQGMASTSKPQTATPAKKTAPVSDTPAATGPLPLAPATAPDAKAEKLSSAAAPAMNQASDNAKPVHSATPDKVPPQPEPPAPPPAAPAQPPALAQNLLAAGLGPIVPAAGTSAAAPAATLHIATAHDDAVPDLDILAVSVAARALSGAKEFEIRLDPPELGRVDVRLSIDASGKTQAHMTADQPQTLNLLQKDAPTLTQALRDAGLDVSQGGLNFSLRGQDRQGGDGGHGVPGRRANLSVSRVIGAAQSVAAISAGGAAADARLDIHV